MPSAGHGVASEGTLTSPRSAVRLWMLDVGCWMFDVGCSMLDVPFPPLSVRRSYAQGSKFKVQGSRFVRCWMLDVGCWMFRSRSRFAVVLRCRAWFCVEAATLPLTVKSLRKSSIFASAGRKSSLQPIAWNLMYRRIPPHRLPYQLSTLNHQLRGAPDHWRWQPATLSLTLPLRLHRFSTYANGVVRPVNSMFLP